MAGYECRRRRLPGGFDVQFEDAMFWTVEHRTRRVDVCAGGRRCVRWGAQICEVRAAAAPKPATTHRCYTGCTHEVLRAIEGAWFMFFRSISRCRIRPSPGWKVSSNWLF